MTIISHLDCALHDAGFEHPERCERVLVIQKALQARFAKRADVEFQDAPIVARAALDEVHSEAYVNTIFALAPKEGIVVVDEDTRMNPYTLQAALRAAGAVTLAVDLVIQRKVRAVFCNVRPPGHHAERERAMGFCFFNNVAVGVGYAMRQYGLKRIAIIDFDVHHGNGTQDIFEHDERVLYCSSFQHPLYPGYEPLLDNEHILSVPLPAGSDGTLFREKVSAAWFAALAHFKPELIFISAGFDAHEHDPIANLKLNDDDYVWITQELVQYANEYCDGKVISVLEGGYNLMTLARCVPLHVAALVSK